MYVCASECLYVHHVHVGACESQKQVSGPLAVVTEVGRYHVGAGHRAGLLRES